MLISIALGLLIIFCYFVLKRKKLPDKFPPGPKRWPFVGSLLSLRSKRPLHETLTTMSEEYGPLVGHMLGTVPCVVVHGYEAVKALCARDDCALRPDGILLRARSYNKRLGVLFSDGSLWREQRRFTLRHLRDFGFGKRSLEGLIHEEIEVMLACLEDRLASSEHNENLGVSVQDLFPVSVINVLWAIMAGKRHKHDDIKFQELMHYVNEFFRHGSPTGGIMLMPWLRYVPIVNAPFRRQLESVYALQRYVSETFEEHERSYQGDSMRDFIDVFIREMQAHKDNGVMKTTFTVKQLVVLCMDLFLAGTETTSSALSYLILYLAMHPRVQKRAREELLVEVGADRLPSVEDMSKLPYVQAVIAEALRHATVLAMTPPHFARTPIQNFMGFDFPKNTLLLVNIYSVLMEKKYWGDPENFRPERFIDVDGKFIRDEHNLVFGTGPRFCLGEPMARNSVFLFTTALLQRFKFSLPRDGPPPNLNHLQGFTTTPQPYRVTVMPVS